MRKNLPFLFISLLFLSAATGFASGSDDPVPTESAVAGLEGGMGEALKAAPCIALKQMDPEGRESTESTCDPGSAGRGQNLVLEFFASWCEYCVADLPQFTALAADLQARAVFRIVGEDDNTADLRAFFQTHDHTHFALAFDNEHRALDAFRAEGTPATYVIGPDRKIKYSHVGGFESAAEWAELRHAIETR